MTGTTSYEWLPGGYFILERVALMYRDQPLEGLAVIGQSRGWRGAPSPDIVARFYDSEGNSIDYIYDLSGDRLIIWIEKRGSDAVYEAELNKDWTVMRGHRKYPSGTVIETVNRKISDSPDFARKSSNKLETSEASDVSES
jgi:hypothetical protein